MREKPKVLLLRMKHVPIVDATGEANLASLVADFQKQGGTILVSGMSEEPLEVLKKSGLYERIGAEHFFSHTGPALQYGLKIIHDETCKSCRFYAFSECASFKEQKAFSNEQYSELL